MERKLMERSLVPFTRLGIVVLMLMFLGGPASAFAQQAPRGDKDKDQGKENDKKEVCGPDTKDESGRYIRCKGGGGSSSLSGTTRQDAPLLSVKDLWPMETVGKPQAQNCVLARSDAALRSELAKRGWKDDPDSLPTIPWDKVEAAAVIRLSNEHGQYFFDKKIHLDDDKVGIVFSDSGRLEVNRRLVVVSFVATAKDGPLKSCFLDYQSK